MIEEHQSLLGHAPTCPKSKCDCGSTPLQAITCSEHELLKEIFQAGQLTEHEAVRFPLELVDKLTTALMHKESCRSLVVSCSCGQSGIEEEALAMWAAMKPYLYEFLGSPKSNLTNFPNLPSEMVT